MNIKLSPFESIFIRNVIVTSAADRVSQHLSSTTVTPEKPETLPADSFLCFQWELPTHYQHSLRCDAPAQIRIMHSQHISNSGVPATPQEPVSVGFSPLSAHIGLLSAQPNSQLNYPRVCFCQTTVGNSTTNMAGYNRCKPIKQSSGLLVFNHPSKVPVLDPYVTIRLLTAAYTTHIFNVLHTTHPSNPRTCVNTRMCI